MISYVSASCLKPVRQLSLHSISPPNHSPTSTILPFTLPPSPSFESQKELLKKSRKANEQPPDSPTVRQLPPRRLPSSPFSPLSLNNQSRETFLTRSCYQLRNPLSLSQNDERNPISRKKKKTKKGAEPSKHHTPSHPLPYSVTIKRRK